MYKLTFGALAFIILVTTGCGERFNFPEGEVEIPEFNFPQTVVFEPTLSAYDLFSGVPADLIPAERVHLLELSAILFTDYAHKQRLIKIPEGEQMIRLDDGSIDFPDGTILTKTFFYYVDERDTSLGKRILETRLLVKANDTWNAATYLWNEAQTEAVLALDGVDTDVSWTNTLGNEQSTRYHVPSQNECATCHQSNSAMTPIGPTLRNLNRMVERGGTSQHQIEYLQSVGVLNDFQISEVAEIPDYSDRSVSLAERGRAYLAMNCAHCHNPAGWDRSAERDFDFRYETPIDQTGVLFERERIIDAMMEGEMPFIGTTLPDEEGIGLIVDYLESL